MDFTKFKGKIQKMKEIAIEFTDKTLAQTAKKISESGLVLKDQNDLIHFINKSENKTFTTKQGEEKIFIKRVFIIVGNEKEHFFQNMIVSLPILLTKAFSQSLEMKMIDICNQNIDLTTYHCEVLPALLIFENKTLYKIISGEENIKKIVKTMSLDINKTIEEI